MSSRYAHDPRVVLDDQADTATVTTEGDTWIIRPEMGGYTAHNGRVYLSDWRRPVGEAPMVSATRDAAILDLLGGVQ